MTLFGSSYRNEAARVPTLQVAQVDQKKEQSATEQAGWLPNNRIQTDVNKLPPLIQGRCAAPQPFQSSEPLTY